jgi:PAS domain S-box-containing protein
MLGISEEHSMKSADEELLKLRIENANLKKELLTMRRADDFPDISNLLEQALAESEARYKALLEANPDIMLLFTRDGTFLDWKASREELFVPPEVFLGKKVSEVLPPDIAKMTLEKINTLINTGVPQQYRYSLTMNGEIRHFESRMVNCGLENILTIVREVTEQVEYENHLKESKEKAEESSRLKSVFLQNMSHELRTPLIGILGYSEILAELLTDEKLQEMANSMNRSGQRLLNTLNSILNISRIEANRHELKYEKVSLVETIEENIEILKPYILNNSVKVIFNRKKEHYYYLDTQIIDSVIMNLLSNAIKFTPLGEVVIDYFEIIEEKGRYLVIKVSDTGIGISDSNQKIIFDAFRQGSEGYDRAFEGVGLGLTITKKYIELLNGKIEVESKLGEGSKFSVYLPISVSEEYKKLKEITEELPRVLLVDDDQLMHDLVVQILINKAKVTCVYNADEAFKFATREKFQIAFIDINLGRGDNGLVLLSKLRQNEFTVDLPTTAITAYAMVGDKERMLRSGFDFYLSKPFKKREIIEILQKSLEKN